MDLHNCSLLSIISDRDARGVILCSTEREARALRAERAMLCMAAGSTSWIEGLAVFTVRDWLIELWELSFDSKQLLHPVQELAVVKRVIDKSGFIPDDMISSTSIARKVLKAYNLINLFNMPVDRECFLFKKECEAFSAWYSKLNSAASKGDFLFSSGLASRIEHHLLSEVELPTSIYISPGLKLSPSEESLINAIAARTTVYLLEKGFSPTSARYNRYSNETAEFAAVASWASEILFNAAKDGNPLPQINLVVPDIRCDGPLLEAALQRYGFPQTLLAGEQVPATPWEIGAGQPLSSHPMIRQALDVFELDEYENSTGALGRIIRSHWFEGMSQERAVRAAVDVKLRERFGASTSLQEVIEVLGRSTSLSSASVLRNKLTVLHERISSEPDTALPSEWAQLLLSRLSTIGWHSAHELNSEEHQAVSALERALSTFRALDRQVGTTSRERALMWLREIVDTRPFQARKNYHAPISILSYEDAAGAVADYTWVLSAHSDALPLAVDTNPFIPTEIQQRYGVESSSPELMLESARQWLEALKEAGGVLYFSYGEVNRIGGINSGCCLIQEVLGLTPQSAEARLVDVERAGLVETSISIPGIGSHELNEIKGGVAVFKDYAEQPFFAFVKHRLSIRPLPAPEIGLSPSVQGQAIHNALEVFWKKHKTSETLNELTDDRLRTEIKEAVESGFVNDARIGAWRYGASLVLLESRRIAALLFNWLSHEKTRTLPYTVQATEQRNQINLHGIPLTVQLDRIDEIELENGNRKRLIIDYKTGSNVFMNDMNASHLKEPQLPIYALCTSNCHSVNGVALAHVSPTSSKFHMRSDWSNGVVPKRNSSRDVDSSEAWQAQLDAWDRELNRIAAGFLGGCADFDYTNVSMPFGYEYIEPLVRLGEDANYYEDTVTDTV